MDESVKSVDGMKLIIRLIVAIVMIVVLCVCIMYWRHRHTDVRPPIGPYYKLTYEGGDAYYVLEGAGRWFEYYGGAAMPNADTPTITEDITQLDIPDTSDEHIDKEAQKLINSMAGQLKSNIKDISNTSPSQLIKAMPEMKVDELPINISDVKLDMSSLQTVIINNIPYTLPTDVIKSNLSSLTSQMTKFGQMLMKEVMNYVASIASTFAKLTASITQYIATTIADPIGALLKWLLKPSVIIRLVGTKVRVGMKNLKNLANIRHPTIMMMNYLQNNLKLFAIIVSTFYQSTIYKPILNQIKKAFDSIANLPATLTFLQPYMKAIVETKDELFEMLSSKQLEELLKTAIDMLGKDLSIQQIITNICKLLCNYLNKAITSISDTFTSISDTFTHMFSADCSFATYEVDSDLLARLIQPSA